MSQSVLWQQREAIHSVSGLNILYLVLIQDIHDCFIMLLSWFFKSIAASPYSSHMAWQTSIDLFASPRKRSSLTHGMYRNISAYICLWISLWSCVSRTRGLLMSSSMRPSESWMCSVYLRPEMQPAATTSTRPDKKLVEHWGKFQEQKQGLI